MTEHSDVVRIRLFVVQRRFVFPDGLASKWQYVAEWPGGKRCGVLLSAEEAANAAGSWQDEGRIRGFGAAKTECRVLAFEVPAAVVQEFKP